MKTGLKRTDFCFYFLRMCLLVFKFLVARLLKVLELLMKNSGQKHHSFNEEGRLQLIWPYCCGRHAGGNNCTFIVGDPETPHEENAFIYAKGVFEPKDRKQS